MMKPPNEKPVFRANEKPAQTKETNYTSTVTNSPAGSKSFRALSLIVSLGDRLLVGFFDGIGGLALWLVKGVLR